MTNRHTYFQPSLFSDDDFKLPLMAAVDTSESLIQEDDDDSIERNELQQANLLAFMNDREYEERQQTFFKVLRELTNRKVHWALACSCSLFMVGFVDEFHDFDLIVDCRDFEKVSNILESLGGELVDSSSTTLFRSDCYAHYRVGVVDFDVIAGFRVCSFGTSFHYELKDPSIIVVNVPYVGNVPIIAIEVQFILYAMMEGGQPRRRFKRQVMERYLHQNGIRPTVLEPEYHEEGISTLPQWIRDILSRFHTIC